MCINFAFFVTKKVTHQKNTGGEKNLLSLMSEFIYLKPVSFIEKENEEGLVLF